MTKSVTMKQGDPALAEFRKSIGSLGTPARKAKAQARSMASAAQVPAQGPPADTVFPINCWEDQKQWRADVGGAYRNEILKVDLEVAIAKRDEELKRTVSREKVREREEAIAVLFRSGLASLVDLVADWAGSDKIIQAQAAFRERADEILNEIADAVSD